jgi:hypothetical protein
MTTMRAREEIASARTWDIPAKETERGVHGREKSIVPPRTFHFM